MGLVQSRCSETAVSVGMRVDGIKQASNHQQHCQPTTFGTGSLGGPHARSGSVRSAPRQPMPDSAELERRFTKVLVSPTIYLQFITLTAHKHI